MSLSFVNFKIMKEALQAVVSERFDSKTVVNYQDSENNGFPKDLEFPITRVSDLFSKYSFQNAKVARF